MMNFRFVSSVTAFVGITLFAIFLVAPGSYVQLYGVQGDLGAEFLGNRAAPLFLGIAGVCWILRTQKDREVQVGIALSMALTFFGIAATGVWAWLQGIASSMILLAAVGECTLAIAFIWCVRRRS